MMLLLFMLCKEFTTSAVLGSEKQIKNPDLNQSGFCVAIV